MELDPSPPWLGLVFNLRLVQLFRYIFLSGFSSRRRVSFNYSEWYGIPYLINGG